MNSPFVYKNDSLPLDGFTNINEIGDGNVAKNKNFWFDFLDLFTYNKHKNISLFFFMR